MREQHRDIMSFDFDKYGRVNVEEVRELQKCQLEILREIDRVCTKHNLVYCLALGSCLGAVRHGGFIPWDDDIDIYMPIEYFEKLEKCRKSFKTPYFLQTHKSDPDYRLMIGRVRNSETTLIEESEINQDINHGIFVDIYPLFHCPKGKIRVKKVIFASMLYRLLLYGEPPKKRGTVMKVGSFILLKVIPNKLRDKLQHLCYHYFRKQRFTGWLSSLYGDEVTMKFPYDWLFPACRRVFEDMQVYIPANADKYLKYTYGDYMKLPPVQERKFHHSYVCVDLDKPYTVYKGKLYCK